MYIPIKLYLILGMAWPPWWKRKRQDGRPINLKYLLSEQDTTIISRIHEIALIDMKEYKVWFCKSCSSLFWSGHDNVKL